MLSPLTEKYSYDKFYGILFNIPKTPIEGNSMELNMLG